MNNGIILNGDLKDRRLKIIKIYTLYLTNSPYPHPVTDHRLRCSASLQHQSRDLFVRKIPSLTATRLLHFYALPAIYTFSHFHHIISYFYFYSNIPIHIVESDTNITSAPKSLHYYKNVTISCHNLKKLIFSIIGNDSRNALSDTIPI